MTTKNAPTEARKLNMEEKRKLEKVLFSDIDAATVSYGEKRKKQRSEMIDETLKKPPQEVRKLFRQYLAAKAEVNRTDDALETLGFGINNYPKEGSLLVHQSWKIKPLAAFESETEKVRTSLADMKRSYTLKLFAGGEEAQQLFATLADELAAIVK